MRVYYDLHIHSCLSPCGDADMTPNNIVNMARLAGLSAIALTDHNACGNCPAILEAARGSGLAVLPGMVFHHQSQLLNRNIAQIYPAADNDIGDVCLYIFVQFANLFISRIGIKRQGKIRFISPIKRFQRNNAYQPQTGAHLPAYIQNAAFFLKLQFYIRFKIIHSRNLKNFLQRFKLSLVCP